MLAVIGFVRSQIAEIERDSALRWYGVAMAFLHVVTYLYWVDQRVVAFVHAQAEPICWPLVPECEKLRVLSAAGVALLLRAYFAAAIGAGLLFASRRLVPGKRDALRVLVTLFYFWAGTLKLNWEWISGAGLYRPMWPFSGVGVVLACVYVLGLELGVAWGLQAKRAWL